MEDALAIRERSPISTPHPTALNLYSLARLSAGLGDLDLANTYYRRALEIDRSLFGESDPFVAKQIAQGAAFLRADQAETGP